MASLAQQIGWWRTLAFHRFFPGVALRRNLARDKEDEIELQLLPALADTQKLSIDVGGNAGSYTNALLPVSAKVVAIEPHPRLARLLRAFPADKVEVHQVIASSEAGGEIELEVDLAGARESDALGHVAQGKASANVRRYRVPAITLDQFADQPVGFVKIDVEGHEMAVIEGALQLLDKQRPILLVESEARHCEGAPFTLFEKLGQARYSGFFCARGRMRPVSEFELSLQDEGLLEGYARRDQSDYVNNFIFVPQERDMQAIMGDCEKLLQSPATDD